MYVYIRSEPGLYTVGFYSPDGKWHAESDFASTEEAARRVAWLNGGGRERREARVAAPTPASSVSFEEWWEEEADNDV